MNERNKKDVKLLYDLIKLARHSRMALKNLLSNVEVIPIANVNEKPVFNQEDLAFHPNGKCGCISLGDDYLFGIRCDHLIWFEGNCEGLESFWKAEDRGSFGFITPLTDEDFKAIMVCGNHKGIYLQKLIVFHEKTNE